MEYFFQRDAVFKRLLKNAASVWGMPESELQAIDPLAKLLIGGLAQEIERIGHEIHNSDQRIFRKQAQFLLPEVEQCAQPSHTVVQLFPEETGQVSRYESFTFENRLPATGPQQQPKVQSFTFTTPGQFKYSPARITHCLHRNELYRCDGLDRIPLDALKGTTSPQIVAIRIEGWTPDCGRELALYFSWLNESDRRTLYRKMTGVRAYFNGEEIDITRDLQDATGNKPLPDFYSERKRLEEAVLLRYNNRFLRIHLPADLEGPSEITTGHPLEQHTRQADPTIQEEGLWVELHFPPELTPAQLQNLRVLDNCVPVMNRKLNTRILDLRKELNLRQVKCADHFIEIDRVESSRGKVYKEVPSIRLNEMSKGAYHLRMGGVGRLDERDGAQYLQYMLELLRSEHSAFSAMEIAASINDLEEMEQILNRLDARVENIPNGGRQPFIAVKPMRSRETVHLHFWSTQGEEANQVPLHAELRTQNPGLSRRGSVKVISKVIGGNNEVNDAELITRYRHALLSHGAIVTKEDISGLCSSICGEALVDVSVEMGIMENLTSKGGLSRCIDIKLNLGDVSQQQAQLWIGDIEQELASRSNLNLPTRITTTSDEPA